MTNGMTNEEAIEVLEVHKAHWERLLDNGICDVLEGGNTIQALNKAIRALKNEQTEQNVGMCQQNVGEMSEQTDVAVDPYDMKYIRGGKQSYNSIKTELNGDLISCLNGWNKAYKKVLSDEIAPQITDGDLISRDYVLSKFNEHCDRCGKCKENNGAMCRCCELDDAIDYVEEAPSAEKTAEWIKIRDGIKVTEYKCSVCGRVVRDDTDYDVTADYPYCHCGCRMKGESDGENQI